MINQLRLKRSLVNKMLNIIIKTRFKNSIDLRRIKNLESFFIPKKIEISNKEISILITGDRQLKKLNKLYRGINKTTDVLSFLNEYSDMETGNLHLGDIAISFPTAKKQAKIQNHSVQSEIELLIIHGFLHLLGFNHESDAEKKEMWDIQNDILRELNNPAKPTEL